MCVCVYGMEQDTSQPISDCNGPMDSSSGTGNWLLDYVIRKRFVDLFLSVAECALCSRAALEGSPQMLNINSTKEGKQSRSSLANYMYNCEVGRRFLYGCPSFMSHAKLRLSLFRHILAICKRLDYFRGLGENLTLNLALLKAPFIAIGAQTDKEFLSILGGASLLRNTR